MIVKRKMSLVSMFVFFMLLVVPTFSYVNANVGIMKNDPGGFSDLYWGESLNEVMSSHQTKYLGMFREANNMQ